jgi:hypothetical protein
MKKFFILIAISVTVYLLYNHYLNEEKITIKDNIVVTQATSFDINSGPSPPPKSAHIEGTIKNIGEKDLKNIHLKYVTGYDTLSALVGFLSPGQSAEFRTNTSRVRNSNPQYTLKEINYNEK